MRRYLVHRVDRLDAEGREALLDRIYPVLCESNGGGVTRDALRAYVFAPSVRRRLCEVVDPEGKTVAFSTFSLRFVQVDGETIGLYRAAGFATSGVGFNPYMARLALRTWLSDRLRWPGRRLVTVGHIVQPLPYLFFRRYLPRMYPIEGVQTPADIARVRDVALEVFDEQVVRAPWIVRAYVPQGRPVRLLGSNPIVAEFNRLNPDWRDGEALVFVLPMTLPNMAHGAGQMVLDLWKRWRHERQARRRREVRRKPQCQDV